MSKDRDDFPPVSDDNTEMVEIDGDEVPKGLLSYLKKGRAEEAKKPELLDMTLFSDIDDISYSISRRPPSDSPYFSESTAEYILDQSREGENKNEGDVEAVLLNIPLRITRLLYDLTILWEGNYLNDIDKNWKYLNESPDEIATTLGRIYQEEFTSNSNGFPFDLGLSIGFGLSAITGRSFEDPRSSDFLAGLMKAYSADSLRGSENNNLPEKYRQESSEEFDLTYSSLLRKYGIEPTEEIEEFIKSMKFYEVESNDNEVSNKETTRRFVEEILDDEFGRCNLLRKKLENEWNKINEASVPGIDAEDVLKSLWELVYDPIAVSLSLNSPTSEQIAKQANKQSRYKRQVSQVLNQLSIEGKEPSNAVEATYENNEIVYYNKKGWELTGYGQILLYSQFEKQGFLWIQNIGMRMCTSNKEYPDEEIKEDNKLVGGHPDTIDKLDYIVVRNGVTSYFDF